MADIQCYIQAEFIFKKFQNVSSCECLSDCTEISYDVEISQAQARYSIEDMELRNTLNETR